MTNAANIPPEGQGFLPRDWRDAVLVGRIDRGAGPTPIVVRGGVAFDVSRSAATTADLLALDDIGGLCGEALGPLDSFGFRTAWEGGDRRTPRLLAPFDLQCVKASGVTFATSAVERVIEEKARGDAGSAHDIRRALQDTVGRDLRSVKPGSAEAASLKAALIAQGLWSQYLEVAIGPDAEIFTKAPILAAVGWGDYVGVRDDSVWNNPEPEIVLACDPQGRIRGAALGNDVNLRDIEGRSALLLGKAKDNNAACAIGPFIRIFDEGFTLDDVRAAELRLDVDGEDGFRLSGGSSMSQISRDPEELAGQTLGPNHQYPDGFALFLGTLFAPVEDRGAPGQGFTHKRGDLVRVATDRLGTLENKVVLCSEAPPWRFGVGDLMRNLARRGLLTSPSPEATT